MKFVPYLLPITLLVSACGNDAGATGSSASAGTFKGRAGDKDYLEMSSHPDR